MNISGAEFSIFSKTFIAQANSYNSFIANYKVLFIAITTINFETSSNSIYSFDSYGVSVGFGFDNSKAFGGGCFNSFEDGIAESRDEYEKVSMGTSLYDSTPL